MSELSPASQIRIRATDRIVVIGPPRTGKSNLQAWFLRELSSWVVIDSKMHPEEWGRWAPSQGAHVTQAPEDILRHRKVVFQPSNNHLVDRSGWKDPKHPWTRALQLLWERQNTTVVFDECLQSLPANGRHPDALRLYTQGAAFNLQVWAGTQFANSIDTMTTRIADHCFCFRVLARDAELVAAARAPVELAQLQQYQFAYHLAGEASWEVCDPVEKVL